VTIAVGKFVKTTLWLAVGLALIALATEPVSIRAQFVLGVSALIAMGAIRLLRLARVWRHVFVAFSTALVMRYFFWRTVNTLPPINDLVDFIPGILLWLAEVYSTVMLFISLFVIADPLDRKPAIKQPDELLPTVDVYIPTYNEDPELLAMTVVAAVGLDYPKDKFNVYVLDDGGTDQKCNQENLGKAREAQERRVRLKALAAELGAFYLTRAKNEHAKAGNMNNALGQTGGEIIVVFDADHVPMKEFLRETVGYFHEDPRLFLCQTPHFFSNPDPLEKNLETFKSMPSENEMFYGVIQKGLDKWNGAFFCGSAALVRRAALEEVGGFSGISITEDCETALDLHSRGWNSCYVDKPMISGLQPETFASFIGQRSRWARGMFQIFLLKNPMFKRGLSVAQKICYLSSMTYWFFPIFRLPFFIAPLLYIWFSMKIYVANTQEFIAYTLIHMIGSMMTQNYLYGSVRWTWVSELYEYVQSIYLSRGLLSVILNPYKPTFNVTDKGMSLERDHLSELAIPYFAIFGVFLVSMVACIWRWFAEPDANELLLVVGMWNFFNLLISGAALGVVTERRTPRSDVNRPAEIVIGSLIAPVRITDVSYGGCRIQMPAHPMPHTLSKGVSAVLSMTMLRGEGGEQTLPVVVSNIKPDGAELSIGFAFPPLKLRHYQAIADLMYEDSRQLEAFRSGRRKPHGIFAGLYGFVSWGLTEPFRGGKFLLAHFKERRAAERVEAERLSPTAQPALPELNAPTAPVALPTAVGQ
jgi:cellulose synthase (UDP-forming)